MEVLGYRSVGRLMGAKGVRRDSRRVGETIIQKKIQINQKPQKDVRINCQFGRSVATSLIVIVNIQLHDDGDDRRFALTQGGG